MPVVGLVIAFLENILTRPDRPYLILALAVVIGSWSDAEAQEACSTDPVRFRVESTGFSAELQNDNVLMGTFRDHRYVTTAVGWESPITSFSLWVAGMVDGEQRISANTASVSVFRPGSYSGGEHTSDCSSTQVYRISRNAIEIYRRTGVISPELAAWPVHLGAPVVDGDGIPGNYNIQGGDVPHFSGDVSFWWLMSDWSGRSSFAMDLEIAVSAFYFQGAGMLGNTLFLTYDIENKSPMPVSGARVAATVTPNFPDGLAGTDTTRGMVFAYNANEMEGSVAGAGPPAAGVILVQDPSDVDNATTRRMATSHIDRFIGSGAFTPSEFLNVMNGTDAAFGEAVYEGAFGNSYASDCYSDFTKPVHIMYPGDPTLGAFWSMEQLMPEGDGCTMYRPDGTRESRVANMTMTTNEANASPGSILSYTYAITWAQGEDRLDSVQRLFDYAELIHREKDMLLAPSVPPISEPPKEIDDLILYDIYPNPFFGTTSVSFTTPIAANIEIAVYDALGRNVGSVADGFFNAGSFARSFNASGLTPGVYFVRFEIIGKVFTRRIVVM